MTCSTTFAGKTSVSDSFSSITIWSTFQEGCWLVGSQAPVTGIALDDVDIVSFELLLWIEVSKSAPGLPVCEKWYNSEKSHKKWKRCRGREWHPSQHFHACTTWSFHTTNFSSFLSAMQFPHHSSFLEHSFVLWDTTHSWLASSVSGHLFLSFLWWTFSFCPIFNFRIPLVLTPRPSFVLTLCPSGRSHPLPWLQTPSPQTYVSKWDWALYLRMQLLLILPATPVPSTSLSPLPLLCPYLLSLSGTTVAASERPHSTVFCTLHSAGKVTRICHSPV